MNRDRCLDGVVGVNIGKNKTSENAINDYVLGVQRLVSLCNVIMNTGHS